MRLPKLLFASLLLAACAPGRNESARIADVIAAAEAIPLTEACTDTALQLDMARSLDTWFDMEAVASALETAWPADPVTVLFTIAPSDDGAGIWSITTNASDDPAMPAVIEAFTESRRNVPVPAEGLMVFVGDPAGPRPALVEGFASCPSELVGAEGVAVRLLEAAEELEAAEDLERIVAIRVDETGRPLSVLYQGESDLSNAGELESLWLLASARFHPAFVHGVPVGALAPLKDADLSDAPIKETYIQGLDGNLFRDRHARAKYEPLGLTAELDHNGFLGRSSAGFGRVSKPSGLDWRLRMNESGTAGLSYFHAPLVWTGNGLVRQQNAPLVHVDVYGRRRMGGGD